MLSRLIFKEGLPTEALLAELILVGLIVITSGFRFTRLASTLSKRLNLGSGWIGLILLATVTSLPELVTGGTATWIGNVDLALGAIFGSCSFNITLIVLLNALMGGGSVLRRVAKSHKLTSSFGLVLIGIALLGLVLLDKFADNNTASQVTEIVWSLTIVVTYLGCMRLIYRHEKRRMIQEDTQGKSQAVGMSLTLQIVAVSLVLVAASWWLAKLGDILSVHEIKMIGRPLGATFVGVCFLALATSLPEIATSISAVRMGDLDLALGNIFGSNMFNIFVIPMLKVTSLAHGDSRLPGLATGAGTPNIIAGLLAILLTAIAVASLAYKSERKLLRRFGFDSILIAVVYVGGLWLLLMDG